MIEPGSKVLDVGCATGILGEYLAKELACDVIGVDCEQEALEVAKARGSYSDLHLCDLQRCDFSALFEQTEFDAIIFGDVLEHLVDPVALIESCRGVLATDGQLLVSLPNVAHGSIKINLLANRFDYTSEGLLDQTHLRFYTRTSILELCKKTELTIAKFGRVFAPIYSMEQCVHVDHVAKCVLARVERDIESWVYQYVFSGTFSGKDSGKENLSISSPTDDELRRFRSMKRRHGRGRIRLSALFSGSK